MRRHRTVWCLRSGLGDAGSCRTVIGVVVEEKRNVTRIFCGNVMMGLIRAAVCEI